MWSVIFLLWPQEGSGHSHAGTARNQSCRLPPLYPSQTWPPASRPGLDQGWTTDETVLLLHASQPPASVNIPLGTRSYRQHKQLSLEYKLPCRAVTVVFCLFKLNLDFLCFWSWVTYIFVWNLAPPKKGINAFGLQAKVHSQDVLSSPTVPKGLNMNAWA